MHILVASTRKLPLMHLLSFCSEYYWRIEPNVKCTSYTDIHCLVELPLTRLGILFRQFHPADFCDLDYDPFLFMQDNKMEYGFT